MLGQALAGAKPAPLTLRLAGVGRVGTLSSALAVRVERVVASGRAAAPEPVADKRMLTIAADGSVVVELGVAPPGDVFRVMFNGSSARLLRKPDGDGQLSVPTKSDDDTTGGVKDTTLLTASREIYSAQGVLDRHNLPVGTWKETVGAGWLVSGPATTPAISFVLSGESIPRKVLHVDRSEEYRRRGATAKEEASVLSGHLANKTSWDLPELGRGEVAMLTMPLRGVEPGDVLSCGHSSVQPELHTLQLTVSAGDGMVKAVLQNLGNTVDIPSGQLRVVAVKMKTDDTTRIVVLDRPPMTHTDLMVSNGTGPWAGFRIPGFTSVRGHLLVFAEGRVAGQGCADFGHHDLVMRRSLDDGVSWEPLRVILNPDEFFSDCNKTEAIPCTPAERANRTCQTGLGRQCDGGCAIWDPMPVVDNRTGTIHIIFGRSTSSCGEGQHPRSTGRRGPTDKADLWVLTSTDLGQSFGTPRNLTMNCSWPYGHGAIGTALHGWVPSGGHGIQLSSGELVAPIYNDAGQGLCISEDGDTWHAGGWVHGNPAKYSGPYEGEVVELFQKTPSGDPRLLYDCRIDIGHHHGGHCGMAGGRNVKNCRMTYTSDE
jgi:hypothetical protein